MPLTIEAIACITAEVQRWLDQVVIGLNLCPFAAEPRRNRQIRICVTPAIEEGDLLMELQRELRQLAQVPANELETTLVVVPGMFQDFDSYNNFLELTDQLLAQFGWEGEFQVASFHPHYCFADVEVDDPSNLTNQSPYPILHLLREASIEAALAHYPHPELIPERNVEQMRQLSSEQRRQLFPHLL